MIRSIKRVKATITAEDRIGREESISLMLDLQTAERLERAANYTLPNGYPESHLREELNELEDRARYGYGSLSSSQYRRLADFDDLIYHKFYNYSLSIDVKWKTAR